VTRTAKIALIVSALMILCVGGACLTVMGIGPAANTLMGCADSTAPTVGTVKDDPRRIPQLFPAIVAADIASTHWQARDARPHPCPEIGPMDQIYSGFVTLIPETAQRYRAEYTWVPGEPPDVPEDLRAYAPADPHWRRSAEFDRDVAGTVPTFLFDEATGTLWFTKILG
jgi:hypothetical protein